VDATFRQPTQSSSPIHLAGCRHRRSLESHSFHEIVQDMVRRDQGARHGSTESSGADTVKDGVGGHAYNGDSFMNPLRDRLVHSFLSLSLSLCVFRRFHTFHSCPLFDFWVLSCRWRTNYYRLASATGTIEGPFFHVLPQQSPAPKPCLKT
jgi:hypothetical protein